CARAACAPARPRSPRSPCRRARRSWGPARSPSRRTPWAAGTTGPRSRRSRAPFADRSGLPSEPPLERAWLPRVERCQVGFVVIWQHEEPAKTIQIRSEVPVGALVDLGVPHVRLRGELLGRRERPALGREGLERRSPIGLGCHPNLP